MKKSKKEYFDCRKYLEICLRMAKQLQARMYMYLIHMHSWTISSLSAYLFCGMWSYYLLVAANIERFHFMQPPCCLVLIYNVLRYIAQQRTNENTTMLLYTYAKQCSYKQNVMWCLVLARGLVGSLRSTKL